MASIVLNAFNKIRVKGLGSNYLVILIVSQIYKGTSGSADRV